MFLLNDRITPLKLPMTGQTRVDGRFEFCKLLDTLSTRE